MDEIKQKPGRVYMMSTLKQSWWTGRVAYKEVAVGKEIIAGTALEFYVPGVGEVMITRDTEAEAKQWEHPDKHTHYEPFISTNR